MSKISKSPERLTFQKQGYIKRMEEKGEAPDSNYIKVYEDDVKRYDNRFSADESRKANMEYDLLTTNWILEKARVSKSYAQNLYAAMCNNDFIKLEVVPILRQDPEKDYWHCSWRYAGGIIADMRQEGDYIDWYCSGIRNDYCQDEELKVSFPEKYVPEGRITDEIRSDLQQLGWAVVPGGDWEKFNI
jgi:hypothetical protein